jgi:hypothetical protein
LRERPVLLGHQVQAIAPRRPQSAFEFADTELHHTVFGLHALGLQAFGLGRGGEQFVECPQPDTAGEGRHARPAQFHKPACRGVPRVAIRQERVFEGAIGRHELHRSAIPTPTNTCAAGCATPIAMPPPAPS